MDIQNEINRMLVDELKTLTSAETATSLLKGSQLSTPKFNAKCLELGYLERAKRPSKSKPGTEKEFWKITDKGLRYGMNQKDPREPLESSPRWFSASFADLLTEIANLDKSHEHI
jgi:hypothetical protein